MKLQYKPSGFSNLENTMRNHGYKKYQGSMHGGKEYFSKPVHRNDDNRADVQMIFIIYDFSEYPQFTHAETIHLEPIVDISRNTDERIEMILSHTKLKTIQDYENFAMKLYDFINNTL